MKIRDFVSGSRDQFNRKYPVEITLKNGEKIVGHIKSFNEQSDNNTLFRFMLIDSIENWKINIEEKNRKTIELSEDEIQSIEFYKSY